MAPITPPKWTNRHGRLRGRQTWNATKWIEFCLRWEFDPDCKYIIEQGSFNGIRKRFPTNFSRFSLMFAITHTRRIPQLSKIDIRDRRRRLFVSCSSSLSLIYPSLLLEDTISAAKWTKCDPEAESRNQYLRISRAQIFGVLGRKGCITIVDRWSRWCMQYIRSVAKNGQIPMLNVHANNGSLWIGSIFYAQRK